MKCRLCGCTDEDACINRLTGETCYWFADEVCSFCALEGMAWPPREYTDQQHAQAKRLYDEVVK